MKSGYPHFQKLPLAKLARGMGHNRLQWGSVNRVPVKPPKIAGNDAVNPMNLQGWRIYMIYIYIYTYNPSLLKTVLGFGFTTSTTSTGPTGSFCFSYTFPQVSLTSGTASIRVPRFRNGCSAPCGIVGPDEQMKYLLGWCKVISTENHGVPMKLRMSPQELDANSPQHGSIGNPKSWLSNHQEPLFPAQKLTSFGVTKKSCPLDFRNSGDHQNKKLNFKLPFW